MAWIGERLGVFTARGRCERTIAERMDGQGYVPFSFLITAVYTVCDRFDIDPKTVGEDVLVEAIYEEVIRQ